MRDLKIVLHSGMIFESEALFTVRKACFIAGLKVILFRCAMDGKPEKAKRLLDLISQWEYAITKYKHDKS